MEVNNHDEWKLTDFDHQLLSGSLLCPESERKRYKITRSLQLPSSKQKSVVSWNVTVHLIGSEAEFPTPVSGFRWPFVGPHKPNKIPSPSDLWKCNSCSAIAIRKHWIPSFSYIFEELISWGGFFLSILEENGFSLPSQ